MASSIKSKYIGLTYCKKFAKPPEGDRATAIDNTQRKFGEVWTRGKGQTGS